MIFNHAACRFDVRSLACTPGRKAGSCLAPAKADAIARAFASPRDSSGAQRERPGALVGWVENAKAPDALEATGAGFPGMSRPMCAWPRSARYDGHGPVGAASSFRCENEAAAAQSRSGAPSGK